MIVWLASYPRSGNTLLRTILYKTMGLKSFPYEFELDEIAKIDGSWNDYYRKAITSEKIFLIKTHRPPRDNQSAIYIVRDGRMASLSYSCFHQRFTPKPYPTLLELVLGGDYYGGWSEHYRNWMSRDNTLVVRYEDLVDVKDELLEKIAETVRHTGEIAPWHNPFAQFHQEYPDFFRKGETIWQGDPSWTPMINAVFFYLHGDLMSKLGYASPEAVAKATREMPAEWFDLVETARSFLASKKALQTICDERQIVINKLELAYDELLSSKSMCILRHIINGLKFARDKSLTLIEKLSKPGK